MLRCVGLARRRSARRWVVVACPVVVQPTRRSIGPLAGVVLAGRQCAVLVAHTAIGAVGLDGAVDAQRYATSAVGGRGGRDAPTRVGPLTSDVFGPTDVGVQGGVRGVALIELLDALPLTVVERFLHGRCRRRRRRDIRDVLPGAQASLVVVGEQRASRAHADAHQRASRRRRQHAVTERLVGDGVAHHLPHHRRAGVGCHEVGVGLEDAPPSVVVLRAQNPLAPVENGHRSERNGSPLCDNAPNLCPQIAHAQTLLLQFRAILQEQDCASFDTWLEHCEQSAVSEVVGFAQGLYRDYAAIKAACHSPWSQGPLEGQSNRLETLKRQLYGRASFALLRCRVLHQATVISNN